MLTIIQQIQRNHSNLLLTHFNLNLPIVVTAHASQTSIGSCIFHKFKDRSMKAIYYTFRSLTETEHKYSQTEKEALAVKEFHHHKIYGRPVTFQSSSNFWLKERHIFYTANRLQRYALISKTYGFKTECTSDMLIFFNNSNAVPDE